MIFLPPKIPQPRVTVFTQSGEIQTLVGNCVHTVNVLIQMLGDLVPSVWYVHLDHFSILKNEPQFYIVPFTAVTTRLRTFLVLRLHCVLIVPYSVHYLNTTGMMLLIPVAARSKECVCSRSLVGCGFESLWRHGCLSLMSVVCCKYMSLSRADH